MTVVIDRHSSRPLSRACLRRPKAHPVLLVGSKKGSHCENPNPSCTTRGAAYLLVENPDDLALVQVSVSNLGARFAVLGGAGVNPNAFPALAPPENAVPVAAYVGRMIRSKGVDLLMQAYEKLLANGVPIGLELFGDSDADNAEVISPAEIEAWCQKSGARWHGQITDVVEVWRRAFYPRVVVRAYRGLC